MEPLTENFTIPHFVNPVVGEPVSLRLAKQLANVSLKQNVLKVQEDMDKMVGWCKAYQEYGNRQAGLDIKYVADRYSKGVAKVGEFMSAKHHLVTLDKYALGQAEILQFCNSMKAGAEPSPVKIPESLSYFWLPSES